MQNCAEIRLGRFELIRELTRGLNSTVYLARDPEIERAVVIKLFGKGLLSPDELSDRLRSVNELSHVGIAKIFDLGYTEPAGDPFLVMEYVEGKSLENVLARGKLPEVEALGLTLDLLNALSCAHAHGICHHNLKPSNMIVTRDGHLKITDFVGSRQSGATPFTAPERLKANGDERSDLFSVGVILYLMLSGFRPFQGNTEATIGFKLVHQHPVPVAAMDLELSPELDFVIGRFLAKNPDERYQTAEEALRDVVRIRTAKEAGSTTSVIEPAKESTVDLLEAMGFGAGAQRVERSRRAARSRGTGRFWRIGVPCLIAIGCVAALVIMKPFAPTVSTAPLPSAHLNVPSAPPQHEILEPRQTPPSKPKKVKMQLVRTAPEAVPRPARQAQSETVAMPVELRQPFRECLMSIWVDDKLAYKNQIRGEKKSRFLHMGSSTANYLTMIQIPAGSHSLRVEVSVVGENYDGSGSLTATFSKANSQKLRITAEKSHPQLDLELN